MIELKQDMIFTKDNKQYKIVAIVNEYITYCLLTKEKTQEFFMLSKQEFIKNIMIYFKI